MKRTVRHLAPFVFALVLALPAFAGKPLMPAAGPAGPEITQDFQQVFRGRETVSPEALRAYRIVLVPGFNADYLEQHNGYFVEQRRELKRLGLVEGEDFELLRRQYGFHGEKTMASNSAAITEYLVHCPKPVLLITHSKGAIDVLEALLQSAEARAKVKGWFSLQAAMGGTVLAEVLSKGWTRPFVETFLRTYGGSISALEDLKRESRLSYLNANLSRIESVLKEVPVIGLTSQKDYSEMPLDLKTLVFLFDPDYRLNQSDGMIKMNDSMIPFAPYVFLEDVDHGETTQQGRFQRVRLLHTMLSLLLQRVR